MVLTFENEEWIIRQEIIELFLAQWHSNVPNTFEQKTRYLMSMAALTKISIYLKYIMI